MLLTGEHRRERSAEGQWCGADLPGLQMMTMLMTLVLIGMMIKDCGKVQICIYIYVLYFVSSVLPKIQGVFFNWCPPKSSKCQITSMYYSKSHQKSSKCQNLLTEKKLF